MILEVGGAQNRTKNDKKRFRKTSTEKNTMFIDFGSTLGSPKSSKIEKNRLPERCQKKTNSPTRAPAQIGAIPAGPMPDPATKAYVFMKESD